MGKWKSLDWNVDMFPDIPAVPACYVVFIDGRLTYVGQGRNLRARLVNGHRIDCRGYSNAMHTPWGTAKHLVIKYRPSVKYGDWAMVELRLIKRLKPPENCLGSTKKKVWRKRAVAAS